MVKRPKSPELAEEARFFTVYQPYPVNANWILEDEQKRCATWVAECIGLDRLWTIYYKPRARGMILLEVSKNFTDHGRLLGEHRWAEILKNPDDLESRSVTQVFHCFYNRLRDCQKDGWKAIPIRTAWFKDWKAGEGNIKQPYPSTYWCDTPPEDKTNKHLCRPIPNEGAAKIVPVVQPPPVALRVPVVGSSKWVKTQTDTQTKTKGDTPPSIPPSPLTPSSNAWQKSPLPSPGFDISTLPTPAESSPRFPNLVPLNNKSNNNTSTNSTNTNSNTNTKVPAPTGKTAKAKPVPLNTFITGEKKPGKNNSWAKPLPTPSFSMKEPVKEPVNAWSKKLNIATSDKNPKAKVITPTSASSQFTRMDYSGWGEPEVSESVPTPTSGVYTPSFVQTPTSVHTPLSVNTPLSERSPAPPVRELSGPAEEAPSWNKNKPNKGKGKERQRDKEIERPSNREKDTDNKRDPTSPAPMDWSSGPPGLSRNEKNKPLAMDVDVVEAKDNDAPSHLPSSTSKSSFPSSSSSSLPLSPSTQFTSPDNEKKRKPWGQSAEGQYGNDDLEHGERYETSRKRRNYFGSSDSWGANESERWYRRKLERDGDSVLRDKEGEGAWDRADRGKGHGRGGERGGRGRGVDGERGRGRGRGGRGGGRGGDSYGNSKRSSRKWGDEDKDKAGWGAEPAPGTSWADMPLSPVHKDSENNNEGGWEAYPIETNWSNMPLDPLPKEDDNKNEGGWETHPIETSWADMPLSPIDKSEKELAWGDDAGGNEQAIDIDWSKGAEGPPQWDDTVAGNNTNTKSWGEDENPFAQPDDTSAWAAAAAEANKTGDEGDFGQRVDTSTWSNVGRGRGGDRDDSAFARKQDSEWAGRGRGRGGKGKNQKNKSFGKTQDSGCAYKAAANNPGTTSEKKDDSGWAASSSTANEINNPDGEKDTSGSVPAEPAASDSTRQSDDPWEQRGEVKAPNSLWSDPWGNPTGTTEWVDPWGETSTSTDDLWAQTTDNAGWGLPADLEGGGGGWDNNNVPAWDSILEESLVSRNVPEPDLICPTHNIACKKGICADMAALVRKRNMDTWNADRIYNKQWGVKQRGDVKGPVGTVGAKELSNGEVVTYKKTRRAGAKKPRSAKRTNGVMRGFTNSVNAPLYTVGGSGVADANEEATGHINDYESGSEKDEGHLNE